MCIFIPSLDFIVIYIFFHSAAKKLTYSPLNDLKTMRVQSQTETENEPKNTPNSK